MNAHVLMAVFRRNFVGYFASPTGYLFIFLFVSLSTIAGFWVPEFFGNNLANLDQLSLWFPFIMMIYIPTITMGIWADERKQGTDELLLTIPAGDFDIVLGKYLAAVGIFSVSLLFSLICNYLVLNNLASADSTIALLPQLDFGLFLGTYLGYWLVGLAMLAIGVIASFLTSNITIGFVLGVLFNMPLVFLAAADAIFGSAGQQVVLAIKRWSVGQRFADFSHGVVTLSGVAYFAAVLLVMLYVSMVLIGRRHWFSGRNRWMQAAHYALRTLALVVIALGAVTVFGNHDLRLDVSSERLSSLSPQTVELIRDLKVDRPVQIEAFVSPAVPESYVQTRLNLLTILNELKALGGGKVQVDIHDTERFTSEAALADKRYGIEPHQVTTINHGALSMDHIFLNVALSCGVQKVPPVFIDRGIPIEYELVRSICTVSQQKRKKVGVLNTDAQLYGSFNMQSMSVSPNWPIIDELEKQYDVVKVDPTKPITEKFDVLLAVQPSSLGPQEMDNFVAAVESGQPTAIFEDPFPVLAGGVPATSMPRQAPGGMNPMMGGQPPPQKGDISKLWRLLGIDFAPDQIIWQDYNPYPKASHFPREFVFIGDGCGAKEPFSPRDAVTAGLQQLLFPFPGSLSKLNASDLEFTPLARTGEKTGTVRMGELMQMSPFGGRGGLNPNPRRIPTNVSYVVAAHIQGKVKLGPADDAEKTTDDKKAAAKKDEAKKPRQSTINVVVVADIDSLCARLLPHSRTGRQPGRDGDQLQLRQRHLCTERAGCLGRRSAVHRDPQAAPAASHAGPHRRADARSKAGNDRRPRAVHQGFRGRGTKRAKGHRRQDRRIEEAEKHGHPTDGHRGGVDAAELGTRAADQARAGRAERDQKINKIETDLALKVKQVQDRYKMWAVLLPPIPPLLVAVFVFFSRRAREREGVARSRLR